MTFVNIPGWPLYQKLYKVNSLFLTPECEREILQERERMWSSSNFYLSMSLFGFYTFSPWQIQLHSSMFFQKGFIPLTIFCLSFSNHFMVSISIQMLWYGFLSACRFLVIFFNTQLQFKPKKSKIYKFLTIIGIIKIGLFSRFF